MKAKTIFWTIIGLAFAWWIINKMKVVEFSGGPILRSETKDMEQNKNQRNYNIEGDYEMVTDFKRCQNADIAFSGLITYSEIRLSQDAMTISGIGKKIKETFGGLTTPYSKDIPILIEGEIRNDSMIIDIHEKNTDKEVIGTAKFDLSKNKISYSGRYEPWETNCKTDITLIRKINN
jgi:hypothetical protein